MDDKNGRQTQIQRWHLTESPISDKFIPINSAEKKQ